MIALCGGWSEYQEGGNVRDGGKYRDGVNIKGIFDRVYVCVDNVC